MQPGAKTLTARHREALQLLFRKARTCFKTYLLLFNPPDHSNYVFSACHEYLADRVQAVVDGTVGKRQAVSMPPQHGKSTILSVEAPSWLVGNQPGIQIAVTGFSVELVTDFSKAIRARVQNPIYKQIFPECDIVYGSNRMDSWKLTNGSGVRAKTPGNKLTGRRVDWLIVDDPHAGREEAESPTLRKRVIDWYFADCYSRLSPNATVFVIGTRWHPQDLIGHLTGEEHVEELKSAGQEQEIFEVTNLAAVCEDEEADPLGRGIGEALFPEVRDEDFLAAVKATIPSYEWDSQYRGTPKSSGSGQVDTSKLVYIDIDEVPAHLERVRAWDLALTEEQKSDWTAGVKLAYDEEEDVLYIIDIFRNKRTWVKNRSNVLGIGERERGRVTVFDPESETEVEQDVPVPGGRVLRIGIEAVAGFLATYQDVRDALMGLVRVEARNPPGGGKLTRALPWLNKIEAGRCRIVRGAWNKDFVAELEGFPDGDHDDQVDGVSIGWEMLTGRNRNGRRVDSKGRRVVVRRPNPVRPGGAGFIMPQPVKPKSDFDRLHEENEEDARQDTIKQRVAELTRQAPKRPNPARPK